MKQFFFTLLALFASLPALAADKQSTFDRIMTHETIRCGYAMWSPILYQNLETGKLEGFAYDLMEEVGKRLSLKIEWAEETGWGTIVEGLKNNRYDMICVGIAHSSERSRVVDFTDPFFYSPVYTVVRMDDTRFDKDLSAMNDPQYKIAVLEGEMTSVIARQSYPKASISALAQIADYSLILKEIETKKADATFVESATFAEYEHNNPDKLKVLDQANPVAYPVAFALPQNDLALKNMINVTVNELINDGTVERLLKKYETYPGTFLRVSKPFRPYQKQQ